MVKFLSFELFDEFSLYLQGKGLRSMSKREISDQLENLGFTTEKRHPPHNQNTTWVYVMGLSRPNGVMTAGSGFKDTKDTEDTAIPTQSPICKKLSEVKVSLVSSVSKADLVLVDGDLFVGRCSGCGGRCDIVAVNKDKRVAYCESCYEGLD